MFGNIVFTLVYKYKREREKINPIHFYPMYTKNLIFTNHPLFNWFAHKIYGKKNSYCKKCIIDEKNEILSYTLDRNGGVRELGVKLTFQGIVSKALMCD